MTLVEKLVALFLVFVMIVSVYHAGYNEGQKDFIRGKIKFQSITNEVVTFKLK